MSILGKLFYNAFYARKNRTITIQKYGGRNEFNQMVEGEKQMRAFALSKLNITQQFNDKGKYRLNFLTGEKFIHQSLFCVHSFFRLLSDDEARNYSVTFFDDNTLKRHTLELLKNRFPNIRIVPYKDSIKLIEKELPKHRYPYIHKKMKELFFFNKLFFVHPKNNGLQIYLDSDMLFVGRPTELLLWLEQNHQKPNHAFAIKDIKKCYGYDDKVLSNVAGRTVDHQLNAGFYGIHSQQINFDKIEALIKKLEDNYGPSYFMEQFITSILLSEQTHLKVLSAADYIVFPKKEDIDKQLGCLHHYVDVSKHGYFTQSWKAMVKSIPDAQVES